MADRKRETRNQQREIARITKGLTRGGLKVSRTEFDTVTGRVTYYHTAANGEERAISGDDWEDFIRNEKARRQDNAQ